MSTPSSRSQYFKDFLPTLWLSLQSYQRSFLRQDMLAGITVAIVALPLAMGIAIASGATPEKGLITAVIAGLIVSGLGGSRFQIAGPTAAFIAVVAGIVSKYGYDGLLVATLMGGCILTFFALFRLGDWIKYVPFPVVTGFTSGIAVVIFTSQVKDFLGISYTEKVSGFVASWQAYITHIDSFRPLTLMVGGLTLGTILILRRFAPKMPAFLIGVLLASAVVAGFSLPVDTIGSRFGELPSSFPAPSLPHITMERLLELWPSALTIAFLAGVESLLSCVVADGMTSTKHNANAELLSQGVANIVSPLFAGLPVTGAIARTATNIRSGGVSGLSGILHAIFILLFFLLASGLARYVPLPALSAILIVVAWNMSEIKHFKHVLSAPRGDILALLATFILTVVADLTVAIETGVVLSAIIFMHRMSRSVVIKNHGPENTGIENSGNNGNALPLSATAQSLASDQSIEIFQMNGPLFFGVANMLRETLEDIGAQPKIFILKMELVPLIDISGAHALKELAIETSKAGTQLILSGLQPEVTSLLTRLHFFAQLPQLICCTTIETALEKAKELQHQS
ncbi:MAG: SulP family inorganic anion transporter [Alphaproteobacteria bacterium]